MLGVDINPCVCNNLVLGLSEHRTQPAGHPEVRILCFVHAIMQLGCNFDNNPCECRPEIMCGLF